MPIKVLIVCVGNTCRSPMAAGLLRRIGETNKLELDIGTAGLSVSRRRPVADKSREVMQHIGIDISREYSKPVTHRLVEWADLILCVEREYAGYLREDYPLLAPKINHLHTDVVDPLINDSITDYLEARDKLCGLLQQFVSSANFRSLVECRQNVPR